MKLILAFSLSITLLVAVPAWCEPVQPWTLGASIQRAVEVAPEIKTAEAEIGVQRGKLEQADAWPNPNIQVKVDDKLGIEDGNGGYDFREFAISQPLPFARLGHQRKQASATLASAQAQRSYQQLLLEYKVAHSFHALQLAETKLELAKQRLVQATRYQDTGHKQTAGDPLVRYLTPLEHMRLDIVLQTAKQAVDMAEGEFSEAAASFRTLLDIPLDIQLHVLPLSAVAMPKELTAMEAALQDHPGLVANRHMLSAAESSVDVAKSQRFEDPTLTVFREKDYLVGQQDDITGVILSVQIPLWNTNNGQVSQARYAVQQAQAELELKQRQLRSSLHKSYLHLAHLIEQAEHYRTKLLQPAQQVFKLTRKGFDSGALDVLNLIDATNTYFDTQERYYTLLQESWLELAELRKSAGLSLLSSSPLTTASEVK